ncbi:MAG: SMP-30/gluconolaconase/LRE-like region-containing protein [Rhizobacter sp.]|nr:SMP-30/gluconolaconase/LRE-like region-containing protein [Rhizobacter sp.]
MDIDLATPEFERIVDREAPLDLIAHGLAFGEGAVWDRRTGWLYWVDIIGSTIWKWKPGVGREVVMKPSGHANGLTFDREGRLTIAGWCNRCILRIEHDGSISDIASKFEGKKFNSPNDIVVRSDGSIYWTDSAGGLAIPGMVAEDVQRYLDVQGVFQLTPDGREVRLVIGDCTYPNGLAFTPDEKQLYVNDTRLALIRIFDVNDDGTLGPGRLFHKLTGTEAGVADGMKVDVEGNLYCTGPGGVHVIDPQGRLLGRLRIPGHSTNMAWGDDDWRTLYVTTYSSVYRTRVKVPGVAVW